MSTSDSLQSWNGGTQRFGEGPAPAASLPSFARIAVRYAIAAAGCVAFNLIYAQFAHGVASAFMTYMFAIPLVLGALPVLGFGLVKARPLPVAARQAWGLAVAALVVASCLHGIFDIAGTASPWLPVYLVAAAMFACAAAIAALRARRR